MFEIQTSLFKETGFFVIELPSLLNLLLPIGACISLSAKNQLKYYGLPSQDGFNIPLRKKENIYKIVQIST